MVDTKCINCRSAGLFLMAILAVLFAYTLIAQESSYALTATYGDYQVKNVYDSGSYYAEIIGYSGSDTELVLPDPELSEPIEFNQYISASQIKTINIALTDAQKKSIKSVKIPEGYVEVNGFAGCTSLESINIPSQVTMLSASAFKGCTGLTDITFSEDSSRIAINSMSFSGCTSLKTISLPAGVTFGNNLNVFFGSTSLEEINVKDGGTYFSDNGCLYKKIDDHTAMLITYPEGKAGTKVTLPEKAAGLTVTSTGMHTFRNNQTIEELIIPDSYTSVGTFSFDGCSNLKEITIEGDDFSLEDSSYVFTGISSECTVYASDAVKEKLSQDTDNFPTGASVTFESAPEKNIYDITGDSAVDLLDVAAAQVFYMAKAADENWDKAKAADVNGDEIINIQDLIEIVANFTGE